MISAGVVEAATNPMQGMLNMNYAQMGMNAGSAALNTFSSIYSSVVLSNAQSRQWNSQGTIEDMKMNMIINTLNNETAKMDVTAAQTEIRNESRLKLENSKVTADVIHAEIVKEKRTREASRINQKELNRLFEDNRRQRSSGKPILAIPESMSSDHGGL